MNMNIPERDRALLRKLHALMGSSNPGEVESAHTKIIELLARHSATWNDLPKLLHEDEPQPQPEKPAEKTAFDFNPLDLVHHLLTEYIGLSAHQRVAVTLWIAHSYVHQSFLQTPRLFLTSPIRGCGKTTLLSFIETLALNARKIDGISDAGLFRLLDEEPTLLLDEFDNADLPNSHIKRRVLNAGHRKGTVEARVIKNEIVNYSLFAPVAIAAIHRLHLTLMDRSIVIAMKRSKTKLPDFDGKDPALIHVEEALREYFRANAAFVNSKPELPYRNRFLDNWRPLVGVADLVGASDVNDWPALAREAAAEFYKSSRDEDPEITLIEHCIRAFKSANVDRLRTADLLDMLHRDHSVWAEWEGTKGNATAHPLTAHELATMLRDFDIRPRPFNPRHRGPSDRTARGYALAEFEAAWEAYGREPSDEEPPTPPAPKAIGHIKAGRPRRGKRA